MIKFMSLFAIILMIMACKNDNHLISDSFESEIINLPIDEKDSLVFKSLYQFDDTLMTIFMNKKEGIIIQSYFIDSTLVKIDTTRLGYPVKDQSYIQLTNDRELFVYTPLDSIQLRILSSTVEKQYSRLDIEANNQATFSNETNLITDSKKTSAGFEYRLSNLSSSPNSPMTGFFDFETNKINFSGISYPKKYQDNYFGFLHEIQEVYTDEFILYNPIALSEIWVYNRATREIEVKEIKSQYHVKDVEPITDEEMTKSDIRTKLEHHQANNGNYSRLVFNQHQNCYYRFYQHPQYQRTSDGYFTTYMDRSVSCIKLDSNFNVVSEILLPPTCFFIYFAISTENGFIINNGPLFQNNKMSILKVKF